MCGRELDRLGAYVVEEGYGTAGIEGTEGDEMIDAPQLSDGDPPEKSIPTASVYEDAVSEAPEEAEVPSFEERERAADEPPAPEAEPTEEEPPPSGPVDPDAMVEEFHHWLRQQVDADGSDLHIKVGSRPRMRVAGRLQDLDRRPLTAEETLALANAIIPEDRRPRLTEHGSVDFAHSAPGIGRFRAIVFQQRGSVSMVFRKLRLGGPTFDEIGIPEVCGTLADEKRGLVLVTGPTGSGKTTTLAAMIQHINERRPVHIVTIEDPIEVLHHDDQASINQREVGQDTTTFLSALRDAMRQDPDVILIGEMRDSETVQAALQAAETGHLVLSTLHTVDATETVNRLIDFFPPHQQHQIRLTLAGSLRGIVCQRLVPLVDGGMAPCLEVLVNTGRIAERIVDDSRTSEIVDVIADGGYYGMQSFDQSLLDLTLSGRVSLESALEAATNKHDFQLMLEQKQGARIPVDA
jgi:twitching motility protein PilT